MGRLFGTDGVRGLANRDLTADLALRLSSAAAQVLTENRSPGRRRSAVVGRDPRASGEFLSAAVVAGLAGSGVDVWDVGMVPTPAVAYLTEVTGADFGVMLSASHNPMPDNGIKIFGHGGTKLPDSVEDRVEEVLADGFTAGPTGADVGRVRVGGTGVARYVDHLIGTLDHDLSGLRVVVDAANGAASIASPRAMRALGAEVIELHTTPDGYNINHECGSTHPESLMAAVIEHRADAGIAHDGDADRCLAVDADGQLVDGDQIMAILAIGMKESGALSKNSVVATVMSNLGFKIAMRESGIPVVETAVGDRYVLEAMRGGGYNLGGEQSGHVLLLDHAATGDGTLTAIHLLARMSTTGESLADLASAMTRLPQVLINVPDVDKAGLLESQELADAVAVVEEQLADSGRVLLRPSGTEPLVRVMVEATDQSVAQEAAEELAATVVKALPLD